MIRYHIRKLLRPNVINLIPAAVNHAIRRLYSPSEDIDELNINELNIDKLDAMVMSVF